VINNKGLADLYKRAYLTWGIDAQVMMVIEELAELTQALSKSYRKTFVGAQNELIDEFTDVQIMMEQLEIILSDQLIDFESCVSKKRTEKLSRLRDMLEATP